MATFLGRAGRLAVFAGLGGAALQAALYTGVALCLRLPWHPLIFKQNKGKYRCVVWQAAPISARATRFSPACGTRTDAAKQHVLCTYTLNVASNSVMDAPSRHAALQP